MIAEVIATYLAANGQGVVGSDLFIGLQPDRPDAVVTLYDESAISEPYHNAVNTDAVGLQVLVRAPGYQAARDRLRAIHRLIAGYHGNGVVRTDTQTPPSSIGQDARGRPEWTAHYRLDIKDPQPNAFRQAT